MVEKQLVNKNTKILKLAAPKKNKARGEKTMQILH
jgi:hypothetical protein